MLMKICGEDIVLRLQLSNINIKDKEAMIRSKRKPLVSIMVITYNHEKYIAQALESILMQETEYDYVINVIEDCSTDKTQEVIMRYVERYPDKVKPYFNKKNLGNKITQKNFYQGYFRLTGDYMALLEGDDYWTSPHKLQKQISFLEANPEFVACSHNVIKIYEDGSKEPHRFHYWTNQRDVHTIEDLILLRSYFHTTTLMFRNVFKGKPPLHFRNKWSCEIFITIAHAQYGNIRYFDEDMSVYRAHGGGVFSTMSMLDGWFFNIGGLRRYNQWLKYRYLKAFARSIVNYCNNLLSDKGKQAALPTRYQYFKYFSIRTIYQIILIIVSPPDLLKKLFFYTQSTSKNTKFNALSFTLLLCRLLRAVLLFILTSIQWLFTEAIFYFYKIIKTLLPAFLIDRFKSLESSHVTLKLIRVCIMHRKICSKEGIKIIHTAITVAAHKAIRFLLPEFVKKIIKKYEGKTS